MMIISSLSARKLIELLTVNSLNEIKSLSAVIN